MEHLLLGSLVISVLGCTMAQITNPYSSEGCGTLRACFRLPATCDGTSGTNACEISTSWWPTDDDKKTKFALFGAAEGYVAVGISRTPKMPDTDVYACTSQLTVKRSYNQPTERGNVPKTLMGVSDVSVLFEDNYVKCEFTREQSLEDGDETFFDISGNNTYYSLMAVGDRLDDNGEITYHSNKGSSDQKVSFNEVDDVDTDTKSHKLKKAHGAMMIIAWIGFAAPGITVARYFKPAWNSQSLCGEKVWFAIHRFNMVTTLVLTCAAFVIIFVEKRDFIPPEATTRFIHAIFGCIVMALSITNVIMAIFRPHPGEPKRIYYNWAHRSVGLLALSMAGVTILLALNVNDPFLPNVSVTAFWTVVAFVCYHIITWLLHEILPRIIDARKDPLLATPAPGTTDLPMDQGYNGGLELEIDEDPRYKHYIHGLYTVVVIAVSAWVTTMVTISSL